MDRFGRTHQTIQRLFQRDMPVQVVTPVPANAFEPFAFDRPLDPANESELQVRPRLKGRCKVYAAGQVQCGSL